MRGGQVTVSKGIQGAQDCLQARVEDRDIAQEAMECALCCGAFCSSAGASTSGREREGGTTRGRAIHPVCFNGVDQGHSSQAYLPKALGYLWDAPQALHAGGEGRGERGPSYSLTLSAVDRSTWPGPRSLGEMDKVRVKLPCVHAGLNDANAVKLGCKCCQCLATRGSRGQWRQQEI